MKWNKLGKKKENLIETAEIEKQMGFNQGSFHSYQELKQNPSITKNMKDSQAINMKTNTFYSTKTGLP